MRFISGGPIIPDLLLGERDAGRVVFLCGAGVSIPSGMPTFTQLTEFVIDKLAPQSDSGIRKAFAPWVDSKQEIPVIARTPLDQVFNLLQLEYGRDQVGRLVSERLAVSGIKSAITKAHETIGKISANQDGNPQIVTTNFDHLFEHALGPRLRQTYVPPTFPDLRHNASLMGVTYLHGRLAETGSEVHDYVLSSSDFGRAYLAQGWATSFIQNLLQKFTVVLLGYQAEDPPVKYLFQGINSSSDHDKRRLYAFDQGLTEDVEAKWRDRGVTPIAYPESEKHQSLWETLEAWAVRSENPAAWKASVVDMAKKGPRSLQPHERGMVAHLVRTNVGTKQFAEARPAISAEWLLVFDPFRRYAEPVTRSIYDEELIDPLEAYGLDDDPSRQQEDQVESNPELEDLISWRHGDDSLDHQHRLTKGTARGFEPMPSRLRHLSQWILQHVNQPILAWWVARQRQLHPRLLESLKTAVDDSDHMTEQARKLWAMIFEVLEDQNDDVVNMAWHQALRRINKSGWSTSVIRELEKASEPKFKLRLPYYGLSKVQPPTDDWANVNFADIANIKIKFPSLHRAPPAVSDEALPSVFAALQRNLVRALERIVEAEERWFELSTLYPEENDEDFQNVDGQDAYIRWFLSLLDRFAELNPKLLRAHIDTWPDQDPYIFEKLQLYAWNNRNLFSADEVTERVLELQNSSFWKWQNQRELLFLLRERWSDFTIDNKNLISNRILDGPSKYESESVEDYSTRKSTQSAIVFGWLNEAGCDFPESAAEEWSKLKGGLPEWQDEWINDAAESHEPSVRAVETNDDASVFNGIPYDRIIAVAKENSHRMISESTEYRPFLGLVKSSPSRAILALGSAARQGEYPTDFWDTAISNWPEDASQKTTRLLHEKIRLLPKKIIFELRGLIGRWLRDEFPKIATADEAFAYKTFDEIVEKLLSNGSIATASSIRETSIAGKVVKRSRRTQDYALNSPIGGAIHGLLKHLDNMEVQNEEGIHHSLKIRIEWLLDAPGEGSDHTVCVLAQNIARLNSIDSHWVSEKMVPWFDTKHPKSEPAWNGILSYNWMSIQPVFGQIKNFFLKLPAVVRTWNWSDGAVRKVYIWLVQAALLSTDEGPHLTMEETRDCLRQIDQDGLQHVIWFLGRVGVGNDNGWDRLIIPFIHDAWPKELHLQTEKTSKAWTLMLEQTGDAFPNALNAVHHYLRPILTSHTGLYRFHREITDEEPFTVQFPNETLELLHLIVPVDPASAPYDLSKVLNILIETDPKIEADRRYQRLRDIEASR